METLLILANATAYAIGEFIGTLIPVGIVIYIIWRIIKATQKKESNSDK